jgi:serine/threonine-protein kinase
VETDDTLAIAAKTDDTVARATIETDDTVANLRIGTDDTLLAGNAGSAATDDTLVDEGFILSTAKEIFESAEPKAGLMHEEQARTKRIAPLMVVLGVCVTVSLPFFGGTPWAKSLLYVTLGTGMLTMTWLWWLASREAPVKEWQSTLAWATAFAATCANSIYFGIFSPAPIVMTLAVVIFAQGRSIGLARGCYAAAALTQMTIALLDAFGIAADPGILQADRLSVFERVAGQVLVQTLLLAAYLLGRFARRASAEALAKTQRAMRELARRDVMAKEARDEVRRALNIGGAGRLSGTVFGSYRLAEVIGHGGMGEVYAAEHVTLETPAAVKVIHPHMCQDDKLLERFIREAQLSASLQSPYIVRVLDAGMVAAGPFIAMELLQGHDLTTHFQEQGLFSLKALQALAEQVGKGLDAAAGAKIVHRDIKPQNIFLVDSESKSKSKSKSQIHCKILDFGIARAMSGQATLTVGDTILGTPSYMSPEQAIGKTTDHRSDLHALTAVLYRACTGFVPFTGENSQAVLYSVVHHMPDPPSQRAELPEALDAFFRKGFAKDPGKRYQSGRELSDALERACSSRKTL